MHIARKNPAGHGPVGASKFDLAWQLINFEVKPSRAIPQAPRIVGWTVDAALNVVEVRHA